jgi:hypothetical protein
VPANKPAADAPTPLPSAPQASAPQANAPQANAPQPSAPQTSAPQASAPQTPGSILGWVWHDECTVSSAGGAATASAGCTQSGGAYRANSAKETNEQPLGGVRVRLSAGACPSSNKWLEMDTITADGSYGFMKLPPGTYCISLDPLSEPSSAKLIPGSWTHPAFASGPISTTVTLAAGENKNNVNFGWEYQSLPAVNAGCAYRAAFLGDVTIPDDTVIAPGAAFVKTWRLRNDGTCAWGPGQALHTLAFIGGTPMNAPAQVEILAIVQPGQTVDLSVSLVAPSLPNAYENSWLLKANTGQTVGVGATGQTPLWAKIVVQETGCTFAAYYLGDVTYSDGSPVAPGQPFRKTWRVRNDGTCAWGPNTPVPYLTNVNGQPLGAPTTIGLQTVPPGSTVELSIDMVAPNRAGTYLSEWKFVVNNGGLRGVPGYPGELPLSAQIIVPGLP